MSEEEKKDLAEENIPAETTEDAENEAGKKDTTAKERRAAAAGAKKEKRRLARERKAQYKEYKARRRIIPKNQRDIICPPDRFTPDPKKQLMGFAARIFIIFFAVFAISYFVCDAFGFTNIENQAVSAAYIGLWSLIFTLIFSLGALLRPRAAAVGGAAVLSLGLLVLMMLPDPVMRPYEAILNAFNAARDHMAEMGYYALNQNPVQVSASTGTQAQLIKSAVLIFIAFISLVYVVCLIRRVRLWQFLTAGLLSAGIIFVVFEYNITRSNWGVTLLIASFSAAICMSAYDALYMRKPKKDTTDSETPLFEDENAPAYPAILARRDRKEHEKALKAAEKAEKRELARKRKEGEAPKITVEEEINDYFSEKPKKVKEKKPKLTTAEKKEAAAALKAEKAEAKRIKREEKRELAEWQRFGQRKTDAGAAMGGFAGIGMFLLAMILLIIPALSATGPFKTVEKVDKKFEYIREYVTAILMGDDPALDLLSYQNEKANFTARPTEPRALYYTGEQYFTVEQNSKYNVYLRGWIGMDYDDTTGSWVTADTESETLSLYRTLFQTYIDPSETLMYSFWRVLERGSIPTSDERDYVKQSKINSTLGFGVVQINVKRYELKTKMLYMPAFNIRNMMVTETENGTTRRYLRAYGSDESSGLSYADFYDGIYSSYRASLQNDGYASVSMITTMKNSSFYRTMAEDIGDLNEARAAISAGKTEVESSGISNTYEIPLSDGTTLRYRVEYRSALIEVVSSSAVEDDPYQIVIEPKIPDSSATDSSATENEKIDRRTEGSSAVEAEKASGSSAVKSNKTEETVTETYYLNVAKDSELCDGYTYIVIAHEYGDAVYKIDGEGNVKSKSVENTPEEMKLDEDGEEATYYAPSLPFAVKYFECLTDDERSELGSYLRILDFYTPFVYDTYTQTSSSAIVKEFTAEFLANATEKDYEEYEETDTETGEVYTLTRAVQVHADYSAASSSAVYTKKSEDSLEYLLDYASLPDDETYKRRHELVMAIIDYLDDEENFRYTLYPQITEDESLIGIEKFIAGYREGSCVQYATTAVLMLREMGIPARFVEGYIAAGFSANRSDDKVANYITTVKDSNAHAWIEVWFDGVGWVQYETTPKYYDSMYEIKSEGGSSYTPTGSTEDDEPEEEPTEDLSPEDLAAIEAERKAAALKALIRKIVIICLSVLAGAALIALFILYFWTGARKAQKKRDALVAKIAAAADEGAEIPTREEFRELIDLCNLMLSECGLSPKKGEFRAEYASRLYHANPGALAAAAKVENLSEVQRSMTVMSEQRVLTMLDGIAAEEFGFGCPPEDMPLLARFFRRMYAFEYRHHNPARRLWLWFFAHKL